MIWIWNAPISHVLKDWSPGQQMVIWGTVRRCRFWSHKCINGWKKQVTGDVPWEGNTWPFPLFISPFPGPVWDKQLWSTCAPYHDVCLTTGLKIKELSDHRSPPLKLFFSGVFPPRRKADYSAVADYNTVLDSNHWPKFYCLGVFGCYTQHSVDHIFDLQNENDCVLIWLWGEMNYLI